MIPYTPFGPAEELNIAGRNEEISSFQELLKRVSNTREPQWQLILGQKGIGKSSLLRKFQRIAESKDIFNLYLDFSEGYEPVQIMEMLTSKIGEYVKENRAKIYPEKKVGGGILVSDRKRYLQSLESELVSSLEALAERTDDKKVCILLLDHFEIFFERGTKVNEKDTIVDIFSRIFDFVDSKSYATLTIIAMRTRSYGEAIVDRRRFWDRFHTLRLSNLSDNDLRDAVIKPANSIGLSFENSVIDRLIADSGGDVGCLQKLCYYLVQDLNGNKHVTLSTYEDIIVPKLDRLFEEMWQMVQTETERQVICAVAQYPSIRISRKDIHESVSIESAEVEEVLNILVRKDILVEDNEGKFKIVPPPFREWIRLRKSREFDILSARIDVVRQIIETCINMGYGPDEAIYQNYFNIVDQLMNFKQVQNVRLKKELEQGRNLFRKIMFFLGGKSAYHGAYDLIMKLGKGYSKVGLKDESHELYSMLRNYFLELTDRYRSTNDYSIVAALLEWLATIEKEIGEPAESVNNRYNQAIEAYNEASKLSAQSDLRKVCSLKGEMVNLLVSLKKYQEAVAALKEIAVVRGTFEDYYHEAIAYERAAHLTKEKLNDISSAINLLKASAKAYIKSGSPYLAARSYSDALLFAQEIKDEISLESLFQLALQTYKDASQSEHEEGDFHDSSAYLIEAAELAFSLGKMGITKELYQLAHEELEKAVSIYEKQGDLGVAAHYSEGVAYILHQISDHMTNEIVRWLEKSMQLYFNAGREKLRSEEYSESTSLLKNALRISKEIGMKNKEMEIKQILLQSMELLFDSSYQKARMTKLPNDYFIAASIKKDTAELLLEYFEDRTLIERELSHALQLYDVAASSSMEVGDRRFAEVCWSDSLYLCIICRDFSYNHNLINKIQEKTNILSDELKLFIDLSQDIKNLDCQEFDLICKKYSDVIEESIILKEMIQKIRNKLVGANT